MTVPLSLKLVNVYLSVWSANCGQGCRPTSYTDPVFTPSACVVSVPPRIAPSVGLMLSSHFLPCVCLCFGLNRLFWSLKLQSSLIFALSLGLYLTARKFACAFKEYFFLENSFFFLFLSHN